MKIGIFATGGTIDKVYFDAKGQYQIGDPMVDSILRRAIVTVEYEVIPFLKVDSLVMTNEHREALRDAIQDHPATHCLVTHGTDTMIDTAKVVASVKNKVVVFMGAVKPALFRETDADFNVGCAFGVLISSSPGTYVVMNGKVLNPFKSRKNFQTELFEEL